MKNTSVVIFLLSIIFFYPIQLAKADNIVTHTWTLSINGNQVWVTVLHKGDGNPDVNMGEHWWNWGNTINDAYLFAFQSPDNVRMILRFNKQQDNTSIAYLFLSDLGRKKLEYSIKNGELKVLSNNNLPYLTILPDINGWLYNGKANYNLRIYVDGPLPGHESPPYPVVKTDGIIDSEIIVGSHQPGIPDWQVLKVVNDPRPNQQYQRYTLSKRMDGAPSFRVVAPFMPTFPYIGVLGHIVNYFEESRPPFYYDLKKSELDFFGFTGIQSGIYAINSSTLPPFTDFETPFAWYNFDTSSRYPQLAIRGWYYPAEDPLVSHLNPNIDGLSTFRYSWKTFDEKNWAYSLQVAGPYAYNEEVSIGPEHFYSVSENKLPGWIVSKKWPIITFLEATNGDQSGEGIYYYSPQTENILKYFYGESNQLPSSIASPELQEDNTLISYASLPAGYRSEYQTVDSINPKLYISPIDNKLHLIHAQGGVWYLGKGQILFTKNLNNDAYIDTWIRGQFPQSDITSGLFKPNRTFVLETLYFLNGLIIYSDNNEVTIIETNINPSTVELTPPTNKTTWELFKDRVKSYSNSKRNPLNLHSWINSIPGRIVSISGAKLNNLRPTDSGLRFEIELQPGYKVKGRDYLSLSHLQSGLYIVTLNSGRINIVPSTPAKIELKPASAQLENVHPFVFDPIRISVQVQNSGLQDLDQVRLQMWAKKGQDLITIGNDEIQLLGEESHELNHAWIPPSSGIWSIGLSWNYDDIKTNIQNIGSAEVTKIDVSSKRPLNYGRILEISNQNKPIFILIFTISILVFLVSGLLYFFFKVG